MSPWLLLLPAAVTFAIGAYATYWRPNAAWFTGVYLATCVLSGVCWCRAVPLLDRQQVFVFSLCWDALMVIAFYVVPAALLGGVRPGLLLGCGVVLLGFLLIKVC